MSEVKSWYNSVKNGEIKFVPGLPLLSEYFRAWIPRHVHLITGYTSAGKSQIVSQIMASTAGVHEAETCLFSVEDSKMEKEMSLIGVISGLHKAHMLMGDPGYDDMIDHAEGLISTWPLHIYDNLYTIPEMRAEIKKHHPKITIIDYIQNMRLPGQGIYDKISNATPELFQMASEENMTLIIVSSIDNDSAKTENEAFISTKGAGELAYAAHGVTHLKKGRSASNYDEVEIHIKKNKAFGKCGKIEANFNPTWTAIESRKVIQGFHSEKLKNRYGKED